MASEPGSEASNLDTTSKPEPRASSSAPGTSPTPPISPARLEEIVTEVLLPPLYPPIPLSPLLKPIPDPNPPQACTTTLQFTDSYQHAQVGKWNTGIIQTALSLLIQASEAHKFIVTSTIIQHTTPPAPFSPKPPGANATTRDEMGLGSGGAKEEEEYTIGRRGLHSATGAYWNNERDGTWSSQWRGSEKKGFDVIVTVFWVATV